MFLVLFDFATSSENKIVFTKKLEKLKDDIIQTQSEISGSTISIEKTSERPEEYQICVKHANINLRQIHRYRMNGQNSIIIIGKSNLILNTNYNANKYDA